MIATLKKFKKEGNQYTETLENYQLGYDFTNNSINYRMICETFISDFANRSFTFSFSLWALEPINSAWAFIKNDYIIADTNTWVDAEGNKYFNSGNNADLNNAFIYSTEDVLNESLEVIGTQEISTLKDGLNTEYDAFYNGILMGIIEPQISASIVDQEMNSITSII